MELQIFSAITKVKTTPKDRFTLVHITKRYSNLVNNVSLLDRCLAIHQTKPVVRPPRPTARLLRVRLTDADRVTIVEEFRAGVTSTRKLAQRYGVSDYAIRMLLRQAGIASRQPRTSAQQRRQVRRLWLEGASVPVIAKTVGVGQTTVRLVVADLVRS